MEILEDNIKIKETFFLGAKEKMRKRAFYWAFLMPKIKENLSYVDFLVAVATLEMVLLVSQWVGKNDFKKYHHKT